MGWTTGVSRLSLKDWRACYAEHHRNEQVLLHQNRSLQLKIEELTEKFGESTSKINELLDELRLLRIELSESQKESLSYRKKISKLEEQLKAAKADKYGKSCRRSKDDEDSGMDPTDRTEAEDVYDGSDAGVSDSMSSDEKECGTSSATGQTFNVANRPETYKSMGANGRKIVHKSDRSRVPEVSRVIETKNVVLYSLEMSLVAHEYEMLHVVEPGKKPCLEILPEGWSSGADNEVRRYKGHPGVHAGTCLCGIYEECDLRESPQMGSGHGYDGKQEYFEELA